MSALAPPTERHAVARCIRLHYLDWGTDGRPAVVFLHGGGLNAHTWDRVCSELREDFHCYAVDLRGHGDSEWSPTCDYSLDAHTDDLSAFLDALHDPRFLLVGHSLGGHAAIRYAASQPHRLTGLVVVDTSPFEALHDPASRLTHIRDFALGATEFATQEDAVAYIQRRYPERDRARIEAALTHSLRQLADGHWTWKRDQRHLGSGYFERAVADMERLQPLVAKVTCPTLVVRGEHGLSAADASGFVSQLPDGRVSTVAGAGHNVQSDNPDAFIATARPFLIAAYSNARFGEQPEQTLDMYDQQALTTMDDLRSVYRPPAQRSLDKEVDHLDGHCRDFIAHAPFVVLATASADGDVDASPKGGPPGFVAVLDDNGLAIPDMAGNNRLDSMKNIVNGGAVALLFMVPGTDETLRVNGRATITTDPRVLGQCPVRDLRPRVAILVRVHSAFIHCAKALRRASLWEPDVWPDASDMATPACMLKDHIGLEGSVEDSQRALNASYAATTWKVGGDD